MKSWYLRKNIIITFLLLLAMEVFAHHGWSYYKDELSIDLTVIELSLRNPHDRIIAIDKDNHEWNLLLAPPARNRRFGFDGSTLKVADKIEILGQKHITKSEVKIHCIYKNDELIYTYRYPNGQSSLDFMRLDGNC